MAVTLTIGERRFEVAPYKLRELRLIAPFVEEMNDVAKRIQKAEKAAREAGETFQQHLPDLFSLSRALCEIIAVGVQKVDASMDADAIEAMVDITYLSSLQTAAKTLLEQSGLAPAKGEATAQSDSATETGQELSPTSSPGSSSS